MRTWNKQTLAFNREDRRPVKYKSKSSRAAKLNKSLLLLSS